MPAFCLRDFQFPADYDSVVRLWKGIEKGVRVGASDVPEEIQKKLTRDADLFILAEADGEIVGTVIGGFDGRRGMIYHLAVNAAFRGQGIGGLLMDEVEKRLRARGCRRCYLMVTPDNIEAMRYYERRGWSHMDVHPFAKDLV